MENLREINDTSHMLLLANPSIYDGEQTNLSIKEKNTPEFH
jgi:hypothetical protein